MNLFIWSYNHFLLFLFGFFLAPQQPKTYANHPAIPLLTPYVPWLRWWVGVQSYKHIKQN